MLKNLFTFIDSVAEDWEYAFSTVKIEKKRRETKQETQRVTFASTTTAVELVVTGNATIHPRDRKEKNLSYKKTLFVQTPHIQIRSCYRE